MKNIDTVQAEAEIEIYADCITFSRIPQRLLGLIFAEAIRIDGIIPALQSNSGGIIGLNQKILGTDGDKKFIEFVQAILKDVAGKIIWHGGE